MRLGAIVLQTQPWAQQQRVWRAIEEYGFDVAYVADHLTHPTLAGQWLGDAWTTLAAAGGITNRVELGTLVASATVRNPTVLSRSATTVQDVCGRRFVLGLGAGTPGDAAADRGLTPTARELSERFAEVVEALRAQWSGQATYGGRHVGTRDVQTLPFPAGQQPPYLMLAAHGPKAIALTARHGDGWNTYGGPAAVSLGGAEFWAVLRDQSARLDEECAAIGRDPGELRRSVLLGYGPDRPLTSVDAYLDALGRAGEAGFGEVVVYWPDGEPGSRFWADEDVVHEAVSAARGTSGA